MKKTASLLILAAGLFAAGAYAAAPVGFEPKGEVAASASKGFESAVSTVADAKKLADGKIVVLRGAFVEHVKGDKYLFRDEAGDKIVCELDDDKNWGHVVKDAPMQIKAEVDKDLTSFELEVIEATPLK